LTRRPRGNQPFPVPGGAHFPALDGGGRGYGVDIVRCDDTGRIVEFRVMIRPLQAIQAVHERMGRLPAAGA
jgi:hypothetical protein